MTIDTYTIIIYIDRQIAASNQQRYSPNNIVFSGIQIRSQVVPRKSHLNYFVLFSKRPWKHKFTLVTQVIQMKDCGLPIEATQFLSKKIYITLFTIS